MTEEDLVFGWREALAEARDSLDVVEDEDALIATRRAAMHEARQALRRAAMASRALDDLYPVPAGIATDPRLDLEPDKAAGERHGSD